MNELSRRQIQLVIESLIDNMDSYEKALMDSNTKDLSSVRKYYRDCKAELNEVKKYFEELKERKRNELSSER